MSEHYFDDGLPKSQCSICPSAISWECFSLLNRPLCIRCSKEIVLTTALNNLYVLLLSLMLLVLSSIVSSILNLPDSIASATNFYLIFSIPYGFTFLTRIFEDHRVAKRFPQRAASMTVKLIASVISGWLVCPYEISLAVKSLSDYYFVCNLTETKAS